jgi:hypothetical protein
LLEVDPRRDRVHLFHQLFELGRDFAASNGCGDSSEEPDTRPMPSVGNDGVGDGVSLIEEVDQATG